MSQNIEARPQRPPIHSGTMFALVMAFLSFIIPIVPAIIAIIVAFPVKARIRKNGGDRMNEGLTTMAQGIALFTLVCVGAYLWYAQWKWS